MGLEYWELCGGNAEAAMYGLDSRSGRRTPGFVETCRGACPISDNRVRSYWGRCTDSG